jgi:hypothetical protein
MYFFCKELVLMPFRSKAYTERLKKQNFATYLSNKQHTEEFNRYIERIPQTVWGIPAEKGAAYATMNYLATFFKRYLYSFSSDIFFPIMNAPTSEAVYKPWQIFLQDKGVKFYFNHTLTTIVP